MLIRGVVGDLGYVEMFEGGYNINELLLLSVVLRNKAFLNMQISCIILVGDVIEMW